MSTKVLLLALMALLLMSGKPAEKEFSTSDCKEVGYYIAVSDAHMYYVERCVLQKFSDVSDPVKRLQMYWGCEGMSELASALSKEMSWRLDHPEAEGICR